MAIQLACGSYADAEYAGILYPQKFPPDLRLSAYAMWFDHLEVNASYYSVPKSNVVSKWLKDTPPEFFFDIRVHRVISQSPEKSAKDGKLLAYFLQSLQPLIAAKRLGTFLLVLSPSFAPERHRLDELDALIEKLRPHQLAIELRNPAWIYGKARASTLGWFHEHRVAWVAVDMPRLAELMPPIDEVTDPRLAYLRLHGRNPDWSAGQSAAEKHTYAYNETELREIARRVRRLADRAENVRVVANNHAHDFAPRTALALKEMLGLFR